MTPTLRFLFACVLVVLMLVYLAAPVRVVQVNQGMYRWRCLTVEWIPSLIEVEIEE